MPESNGNLTVPERKELREGCRVVYQRSHGDERIGVVEEVAESGRARLYDGTHVLATEYLRLVALEPLRMTEAALDGRAKEGEEAKGQDMATRVTEETKAVRAAERRRPSNSPPPAVVEARREAIRLYDAMLDSEATSEGALAVLNADQALLAGCALRSGRWSKDLISFHRRNLGIMGRMVPGRTTVQSDGPAPGVGDDGQAAAETLRGPQGEDGPCGGCDGTATAAAAPAGAMAALVARAERKLADLQQMEAEIRAAMAAVMQAARAMAKLEAMVG